MSLSAQAFAQAPPSSAPTSQPNADQAREAWQKLPWPVRLGLRSLQVDQAFPTVDRVVLVPDPATYLDEIAKWRIKGAGASAGRWPVLIEDSIYTPMFVRRFKPAQLIRRESINTPLPEALDQKQKLAESVVVSVFGGQSDQTIAQTFARQQYVPAGVVIASMNDPAWPAAVALAAGHGQPLLWMDTTLGVVNDTLDNQRGQELIKAVDDQMAGCGYTYDTIGDDIDAVTICRALPVKMILNLAPAAQSPGSKTDEPVATTDALCRLRNGHRYAYVGMIFGDEKWSAYVAMCSLFLERKNIWLYNGHPLSGGWETYGMDDAANKLNEKGYATRLNKGDDATLKSWMRMLPGGINTDAFVLNSKGNIDFFDLFTGTASSYEVPVLNEPVALHLLHSWAMQSPTERASVGGRWIAHGAYASVGSCWEPFLSAFLPPVVLAERWRNYVPFLIAARWWNDDGPNWKPWRVETFGDPLMLCAPPGEIARPRITMPVDTGVDLIPSLADLMRRAPDDASGKTFAQAIEILDMLGKDEIAVQLWRIADDKGVGGPSSRAALGPLFRMRETDLFLRAWDQLPARDELAVDMLWHLVGTRLSSTAEVPPRGAPKPGTVGGFTGATPMLDRDTLLQLQSAIRPTMPWVDLERLGPALASAFGKPHVREVIQREMDKQSNRSVRLRLDELMDRY